jgi:DNA polymerase sigma
VEKVSPTNDTMDQLIDLYEVIRKIVQQKFSDLDVLMYGSTLNGLLSIDKTNGSDLDLTLI